MSHALDEAIAAAAQLFDALHRGDWEEAASQVPIPACTEFREQQLASLTSWAANRARVQQALAAGVGLVGWSSDGAYRPERLAALGATPLPGFPHIPTLAALAERSPRSFLALYLEVCNPRRGGASGGPMERPRRRTLGGVADGATVVHVLYRDEGSGRRHEDPYHVELARFLLREGQWSIDLSVERSGIIDHSWFMMVMEGSFLPARAGGQGFASPDV